jgi:hypothetical protein
MTRKRSLIAVKRVSALLFDEWLMITDLEQDIDDAGACGSDIAYTISTDLLNRKKFAQIQICPWFLNYALRQADNKVFQTAIDNNLLGKLIQSLKASFFKGRFTPIDAVAAFEKVLLHEITHTQAG